VRGGLGDGPDAPATSPGVGEPDLAAATIGAQGNGRGGSRGRPAIHLPGIGGIDARQRAARAALWAIVLLGLGLRLYAAWQINQDLPDGPERLKGDEPGYDGLALSVLAGDGFAWPERVPLYPLWLAGIHWLTDRSYRAVPYAQSLLGTAAIPLTYLLARRAFDGAGPALVAAFLAATSYVLVVQSGLFMSEVLFTPVLLLVVLTLWDAMCRPTGRRFGMAGILLGVSVLVRPTLVLLPLATGPLCLAALPTRRAVRCWGVYVAAALLVVGPWLVHNYLRHGAPILAATNAFLWQGSPEYYHLVRHEGYTYHRIWHEVIYGLGWQAHDPVSVDGDRWWTRRALQSIAAEPGVYLRFAVEKLGTYWAGDPQADWHDTHVFNYRALRDAGYPALHAVQLMASRALPVFALLAGLVLRRQWRSLLPLYAVLAYTTLFHAATHAEGRLSDPFQPLLMVLLGGALASGWQGAVPRRSSAPTAGFCEDPRGPAVREPAAFLHGAEQGEQL
jgi:hypothetical protein